MADAPDPVAAASERISWRDPALLISVAIVLIFAAGYVAAYLFPAPAGSEQAIGQMQGAAIAALSSVVAYWLGSSRGSARNAARADRATEALDRAVKGE